jgi:hypothetical protein
MALLDGALLGLALAARPDDFPAAEKNANARCSNAPAPAGCPQTCRN